VPQIFGNIKYYNVVISIAYPLLWKWGVYSVKIQTSPYGIICPLGILWLEK
jgi:hypothetical protein